eukprot:467409-Pleurochrysis_carterae.AAC.1
MHPPSADIAPGAMTQTVSVDNSKRPSTCSSTCSSSHGRSHGVCSGIHDKWRMCGSAPSCSSTCSSSWDRAPCPSASLLKKRSCPEASSSSFSFCSSSSAGVAGSSGVHKSMGGARGDNSTVQGSLPPRCCMDGGGCKLEALPGKRRRSVNAASRARGGGGASMLSSSIGYAST